MVAAGTLVLPVPTGGLGWRATDEHACVEEGLQKTIPCWPACLLAVTTCVRLRRPGCLQHEAHERASRPLAPGWTVRKQLARALRQEGAVLEAIVDLLTAEEACSGAESSRGSSGGPEAAPNHDGAEDGAGDDDGEEADFPPAQPSAEVALSTALGGAWRRLRHRSGATLSRISSAMSLRGGRAVGARAAADAAAMGIHSELQSSVEPIYRMSGPTSASLQVQGRRGAVGTGGWDLGKGAAPDGAQGAAAALPARWWLLLPDRGLRSVVVSCCASKRLNAILNMPLRLHSARRLLGRTCGSPAWR